MKINGSFILREIAGESVLVPVGETALSFNGMIILNSTGAAIWKGLEQEKSSEEIIQNIVSLFDVEEEVACTDLKEFFDGMCKAGILA